MSERHAVQQRIDAVVRRQHGLVSRRQAMALGFSRRMIDGRLHSGSWISAAPGVYRAATVELTFRRHCLAGSLWAAPDGLVSRDAAGAVWSYEGVARPRRIDITFPQPGRPAPAGCGFRMHWTNDLLDEDRALVDGIALTSPLRTALDLAWGRSDLAFELILEDGLRRRLFTPTQLADRADRYCGPGVDGSARVRRTLAVRGATTTDSGWELRLVRVLTRSGLPEPMRQIPIRTSLGVLHPDVGFPGPPAVVFEYDSERWHSSVRQRQRDARRRNALRAVGVTVVEVNAATLRSPAEFIALVRRILPPVPRLIGSDHFAGGEIR